MALANDLWKAAQVYRLVQKEVRAGSTGALHAVFGIEPRTDDERGHPSQPADLRQQGDPVQFRQLDVCENHVGLELRDLVKGIQAIGTGTDDFNSPGIGHRAADLPDKGRIHVGNEASH